MTKNTHSQHPLATVTHLFSNVRDEARARRAARAERRQLRAELETYRTPSAINDLIATIDRNPGRDRLADEARNILAGNLATYERRHVTRSA